MLKALRFHLHQCFKSIHLEVNGEFWNLTEDREKSFFSTSPAEKEEHDSLTLVHQLLEFFLIFVHLL